MSRVINSVIRDVIKKKIEDDIRSIAKAWSIEGLEIEFEDPQSIKTIFITLPYKGNADLCCLQFDFIQDLTDKGYWISMIFAHKTKGLRMFTSVKKQF